MRFGVAIAALGTLALLALSRTASAASAQSSYPTWYPPGTIPPSPDYPLDEFTYPVDEFPFPPYTPPRAPIYTGGEWDVLPPAQPVAQPVAEIDLSASYTDEYGYTYYFDVNGNYVGMSDLDGTFYPTDTPATMPPAPIPEPLPVPVVVAPADQGERNMLAMLAMIARAEGTDPNSYGMNPYGVVVGYEFEIADFSDHPARLGWSGNRRAGVPSTAAGKYQAMLATWNMFIGNVGPRDFSPESQEEFARWAIDVKRRVGNFVRSGRFAEALRYPGLTCEWASLPPGCNYGQPKLSWDDAGALYAYFGGSFADTDPLNVALAQATGAPLTA